MKTLSRLTGLVLFITLLAGCKKSSSDDQSALLAVALAQNGASCLGATTLTKGGAAVSSSKAGFNYYYYTGGGTTDTVTFTSSPSGGAGALIYIANTNIIINASNIGVQSNFAVFGSPAPYSNSSVTTNAGSYRCFVVTNSNAAAYTLQIQ